MFLSLLQKECVQVGKSLIYWLYILCLICFFTSQMGHLKDNMLAAPQKGQDNYSAYGYQENVTQTDQMSYALSELMKDYFHDSYTTYPVGYAKDVRLSDTEKAEIAEVLYETTGIAPEEIPAHIEAYYQGELVSPRDGLTYDVFLQQMKRVTDILGPGSSFTEEHIKNQVRLPLDYDGAVKAYNDLTEKDGYTGGYTRLFCDYMGIAAGILPVFAAATRMLRDRRAQMQELVFTRRASSTAVIVSRFLAMTAMLMLPLIALSLMPTIDSILFTKGSGIALDYLAFLKYDLLWLLPTVLAVTAAGMFFTVLTDTALAVFLQTAWWFISVQLGVSGIYGGKYGWNLIPRHNTEMNYSGFSKGFHQLFMNRILYTVLAVLLVAATVWIYEKKRKGHLNRHGHLFGNRKKTA